MISRYEATLNNVALSSIDGSIYIADIQYASPSIQTQTVQAAKRQGAFVTDRRQEKSSVTVTFEIRKYGIADRQSVCQAIVKWAMNGGILETNDRPGQRLRVICGQPPVVESTMHWTDELSVVFDAYSPPYWEEKTAATQTLTGSDADGTVSVPGSIGKAPVDVTITPSSTLTGITIYAGDTYLSLSGISVTSSQTVEIFHDENGFLHIESAGGSLLNKRTGSDDLLVQSGRMEGLSVSANVSVTAVFSVRGYWL